MGEDQGPGLGEPPPPRRIVIPPELLESIGKELALTVDAYNVGETTASAAAHKIDPATAKPVIDSVRMSPTKVDMVGKLTPFALEEWGIAEQCSPSGFLLAIFGMSYMAGVRARQLFAEEAAKTKAGQPEGKP